MKILPLTLVVLAVLMLSMTGSYFQHRYYLRIVNDLAATYGRAGYVLASGIRKSRWRGAIAVLVLRRDDTCIAERVMVMEGTTLFARFREHPELVGRLDADATGRCSPAVRGAVEDAMARGARIAHPEIQPVPALPRKARALFRTRGKESVHG